MSNLHKDKGTDNFYVWVDPTNYKIYQNIRFTRVIRSNPVPPENNPGDSNLLFIPNPNYNNFVTPYHNNIINRIRAEYWLEFYRPKQYPSRLHALFICNSEDDAIEYRDVHPDHIKERILIRGLPIDSYTYSIHDSGWFDYLCKDAGIDETTIEHCAREYWKGTKVEEVNVTLYGRPWIQKPTMEVLFLGNLQISEQDKSEIINKFEEAYKANPNDYPPMFFD